MTKLCDAIMVFEKGEESKFVCCDLEDNHNGNHRALMFEWVGEGETQSDFSTWARGLNLLKMKCSLDEQEVKYEN